MRRRQLLLLGLTLPLLAASPAAPIIRRAEFKEVGDSVIMKLRLPELLPKRDLDAMDSLSSGFATHLVYEITLYRYVPGQSKPERHSVRHVRVHYDLWNEKYVVETVDDAGSPGRVQYRLRDDAIADVATLRVRVGKASEMLRGSKNAYFVGVFAQRNPTKEAGQSPSVGTRGQNTDLRMFNRWVSLFLRSRLKAEKTLLLRTNHFYLVEP